MQLLGGADWMFKFNFSKILSLFSQGILTVCASLRAYEKTGRRRPEAPPPRCLGRSEALRPREAGRKRRVSAPAPKWWDTR